MKRTALPPPALPPNSRGWHAAWRGAWGPLSDGRSKISRLVAKIARELGQSYGPWATSEQRRRAQRVARLRALAEKVALTIGTDPKATLRALTALEKQAANEEARLLASLRRNGHKGSSDLEEYLAATYGRVEDAREERLAR